MATTVALGSGKAKVRSYGVGLLLSVITIGIYFFVWYYRLNVELKRIGESCSDPELAASRPGRSLLATSLGWILIVPPLISLWGFGKRLRRAENLVGVPSEDQFNAVFAFSLYLAGTFLFIPGLFYFYLVTEHQNGVIRAAGTRTQVAIA